jgi:CheY-like chemotaxis protein
MRERILLVDDQPSFLSGLQKALQKYCDYSGEIITVENGENAINEVLSSFYDICFLDISLPDINGLDVMRKVRETSPETKLVIMTASDLDDDKKKKIEHNAAFFLPKPVDQNILRGFIERERRKDNENGNGKRNMTEKREFWREAYGKNVHCSLSVFYNWELKSDLEVYVTDLSNSGAGIKTLYPLCPGNILRFSALLSNKSGIVKWIIDNNEHYKVGIKFI